MARAKNVWDEKRGIWQPRVSEEMILKEIVVRLWLQAKIPVWRINCPVGGKVRPNVSGIPDLVGYIRKGTPRVFQWGGMGEMEHHDYPALPLFIEVKRPGGARRTAQIQFIKEAAEAGCAAFFAESWEDVVLELDQRGIKVTPKWK